MIIRVLSENNVSAYRALRLEALQESPTAFRSSYEEEVAAPLEKFASVLRDLAIFGAFTGEGDLIGLVGYRRENRAKLAHNALIVGVHVNPAHRRQGVGGALLDYAIEYAQQQAGLRMLKLSVTANNQNSIRLCLSRGFKSYGLEPDALCVDGKFYAEESFFRRLENIESDGGEPPQSLPAAGPIPVPRDSDRSAPLTGQVEKGKVINHQFTLLASAS